MTSTDTLQAAERHYLADQRLGRLATIDADGRLQNNPVGFHVHADGSLSINGHALGATRKFRNVAGNPEVAFVVDDVRSVDPWVVRGVEIRGTADALTDVDPPAPWMSREEIRIHPRQIISWGLDDAVGGVD